MSTLLSARPVREHMGHLGLEIMCLEMTPGFSEIHLFKLISLQLIISRGALIEKNKQHGHVWSSSHHTWSPAVDDGPGAKGRWLLSVLVLKHKMTAQIYRFNI